MFRIAISILALCALSVHALDVSPEYAESSAAQATVGLTIVVSVGFAVYVVLYYRRHRDRFGEMSNDLFVTAREKATKWDIAWSFYASAIGSWVLTGPADLAFWSGLIAVFAYGIATGIPALVVAYFGSEIRGNFPGILSLSDFAMQRFGRGTQVLVVIISLFNMSIATASEYTTVAAFFSGYVGLNDYDVFIVLTIAGITLAYTAYGGLIVSILTDKVQAIASLFLVTLLTIYILATLKPLPSPESVDFCTTGENTSVVPCSVTFLDQLYGTTTGGYSTIFTLPLSLVCATIYSEAFWQRAWAAEDTDALKFGAKVAAGGLFVVVSIFGLIGVYGGYTGLTGYSSDPNLRVFQALEGEEGKTIVSSGWGVLLILLGVIMSQAALDSLQNGIGASVNGVTTRLLEKTQWKESINPLTLSRTVTIVLNVPLIIIGLQKYEILRLFLVGNMVTSCATFPLAIGFVKHPFLDKYISDAIPPIASLIAFMALILFGGVKSGQGFTAGIQLALWDQLYEWDFFLVAFATSVGATGLMLAANYALNRGREPPKVAPDEGITA